jgi:hypothetical protein
MYNNATAARDGEHPSNNRLYCTRYTDKKENPTFFICKEIQNGAVAKSYMTNSLLIYG